MEIRKLLPPEYTAYNGICTTVFFDMPRVDIRAQLQAPPNQEDDGYASRWGAFDLNGHLLSALSIVPFVMVINGKEVKMAGIGGVVTRPESRGLGLVKKIMEKAFEAMVQEGYVFSFLYPFNFSYYRNFGYETCYTSNKVTIPINNIVGYGYPKNISPLTPGDDITPVMEIYREFTKNHNLAIVRSQSQWEKILNRDPYQNLDFTFVNYNAQGVADAYILYKAERDSSYGNNLNVNELCWRTPEGLHSILGFLSKLGAEFKRVCWNAPCGINIHALFPECYDLSWSKHAVGMNRIVDATAALNTIKPPVVDGNVTINVIDRYYPGNTGVYNISWEGGHLTTTKLAFGQADMHTTIETMTQLVTGYITPQEAVLKGDTTIIYSQHDMINLLFPKQSLYLHERF